MKYNKKKIKKIKARVKLHNEKTVSGVFSGTGKAYGFVTPDSGGKDYFIPPRKTGGALHGDRVRIKLRPGRFGGENIEAQVEQIESRSNKFITGRVVRTKEGAYLEPDSPKLPKRIDIKASKKVRAGDKAALKIMSHGEDGSAPNGVVHQVFGRDGTLGAAVSAVLFTHEIEQYFSVELKAAAAKIPQEIDQNEAAKRLDLREELIFTIDGDFAKDLDDAVSVEKTEEGYILGVHIADVSHYVGKGSALDREAFNRGTSVYFADRVIPMLPPELSNGICSLNPKTDRLTMSVIMSINKNGAVADYTIAKSVIRSREKMTYNNCNAILSGDPELSEKYSDIKERLFIMSELADIMLTRRLKRGALEFETSESVIFCDKNGRPVDIIPATRGVSERIIEEFMLVANETVAEHMCKLGKPAIYRVHEKPEADKIRAFAAVAANLGYKFEGDAEEITPKMLQTVLNAASGKPEEKILSVIMLRSLMKARYSEENLGHFGLAAKYYCHFTSPIRRYPDLAIHRFLTNILDGTLTGNPETAAMSFARKAARQASERELAAMAAEREIDRIYKAEYMKPRIGETFEGVISGAQPFGVFVELGNYIEGFLALTDLEDDNYYYNENTLSLIGQQTQYVIGQSVRVVCAGVSVQTGRIDFTLAEK